jgi:hypothetical protein
MEFSVVFKNETLKNLKEKYNLIQLLKELNIGRIYLTLVNPFTGEVLNYKKIYKTFLENGIKTGLWFKLLFIASSISKCRKKVDWDGRIYKWVCPRDDICRKISIKIVKKLSAKFDVMIIDDQMRFTTCSFRPSISVCFCDKCMNDFNESIGKNLDKKQLKKKILFSSYMRKRWIEFRREFINELARNIMSVAKSKVYFKFAEISDIWFFDTGLDLKELKNIFDGAVWSAESYYFPLYFIKYQYNLLRKNGYTIRKACTNIVKKWREEEICKGETYEDDINPNKFLRILLLCKKFGIKEIILWDERIIQSIPHANFLRNFQRICHD